MEPNRRPRRRIDVSAHIVATALVIGLVAASCTIDDQSGPTSTITTATTTTAEPSTTSIDAADVPLLGGTRWVRLHGGELLDDDGRAILASGADSSGGPSVHRSTDGTVYVLTGETVVAIGPEATEPIVVLDRAATELARLRDGTVVARTEAGTFDLRTGTLVEDESPEADVRVVAANGLSAERTDGIFESDDAGRIARVIQPEGVRLLDERGEQNSRWELGGPSESQVSLIDFDGRFLLASRGSQDPRPRVRRHFLIDVLGGSFEYFDAVEGTVALATADDPELPSVWRISGVEGCPTWSSTPPKAASAELSRPVAQAYDQIMLGVIRCDSRFMGDAGALLGWDDTSAWRALMNSLIGASRVEGNSRVWDTGLGASITIADDGSVAVAVDPNRSFELYIIRDGGHLGVWGSVGPRSAAGLRAAGTLAADRLGLNYYDWGLSTDGPELEDQARQGIEEFIGTSIGGADDVTAVDAHVTSEALRVWARTDSTRSVLAGELARPAIERAGIEINEWLDTNDVGAAEVAALESLQAFAAGGRLDDINWAPEVVLAAGPTSGAIVIPDELSDPNNWDLDVGLFRAGEGNVSALSMLTRGPWGEPQVGPHPHCASGPMRSPAVLAGLRRISIQRTDIDSCLSWGTVDLFFDTDGRIAGVSVDYWEP